MGDFHVDVKINTLIIKSGIWEVEIPIGAGIETVRIKVYAHQENLN